MIRFKGSEVQGSGFKGSEVQGSGFKGSGFKGSEVQGSKVQGSRVQRFKGSGFRGSRFRPLVSGRWRKQRCIRFEDRFARGWRQKKTNIKSTTLNQIRVP